MAAMTQGDRNMQDILETLRAWLFVAAIFGFFFGIYHLFNSSEISTDKGARTYTNLTAQVIEVKAMPKTELTIKYINTANRASSDNKVTQKEYGELEGIYDDAVKDARRRALTSAIKK